MKKIIKIAEARAIAKSNPNLDADDLMYGIDRLNKGDMAPACMMQSEYDAVALFLITREIVKEDKGGETMYARQICKNITDLLGLPYGCCEMLVRRETARHGRFIIAELNMGLNHLTITKNNPYAKVSIIAI